MTKLSFDEMLQLFGEKVEKKLEKDGKKYIITKNKIERLHIYQIFDKKWQNLGYNQIEIKKILKKGA